MRARASDLVLPETVINSSKGVPLLHVSSHAEIVYPGHRNDAPRAWASAHVAY